MAGCAAWTDVDRGYVRWKYEHEEERVYSYAIFGPRGSKPHMWDETLDEIEIFAV